MASEQASHTYEEKIHYMKLCDKEVHFRDLTAKRHSNLEM